MTVESRRGTAWAAILAAGMATMALVALFPASSAVGAGKGTSPKKAAAKHESEDPNSDEDGLHLDSDEVDADVTAFVIPADKLGDVKKIDRMKFAQEVRALLVEGTADPTDGATTAKRHFDAARRLVPGDPRAAYAYGVVLLKYEKPKEALEQFQAAARDAKGVFLPGFEAVAWVQMLRSEHERALASLRELARRIEQTDESWPTLHDREHSAEWLGRFIGYLAGPGKSAEHAAEVEALAADLSKLLTGARKRAFEHGQKLAAARYEELKAEAARPVDEVLAEARQKREELQKAALAAEADVKRIEAEIRDIKRPADKQVADLNRDLRENANRAKRAQGELEEAEEAVAELAQPRVYAKVTTTGRYRTPRVTPRGETSQEKKAREQALSQVRQKVDQLQAQYRQAKDAMSDIQKQRDQVKTEARRATTGKVDELTAARRKAHELSARAHDAELVLTADKLKARVTALESYVPLNPELQKKRLLASFASHASQ